MGKTDTVLQSRRSADVEVADSVAWIKFHKASGPDGLKLAKTHTKATTHMPKCAFLQAHLPTEHHRQRPLAANSEDA